MTDKAKQAVLYQQGRAYFIDIAKFEAMDERIKMIPVLERKVLDAAVRLALADTTVDHIEEWNALEDALLEVTQQLLAARRVFEVER